MFAFSKGSPEYITNITNNKDQILQDKIKSNISLGYRVLALAMC